LQNISHIDAKIYATDGWESYNLIDRAKRIVGKAHTFTVERTNRLLRHYLARFARKTYCWSKSLEMIENSVLLFMNKCTYF
jgi:insertion element IS1 protein InsB